MTRKPDHSVSPHNKDATRGPTNVVPGLETIAISLVTGWAAKFGPSVAQALYVAWKGKESHFTQIVASSADATFHYIVLRFFNLSAHGLYLEHLWLTEPAMTPLEIYKPSKPGMSFGDIGDKSPTWLSIAQALPRLIASGDAFGEKVVVRFKDFTDTDKSGRQTHVTFGTRDAVTVAFQLSALDKSRSTDKEMRIRLRHQGPLSTE